MKNKIQSSCDSCEFYDWDEEYECYLCTQNLDEDDRLRYLTGHTASCPFYRFHDEYKTVQKQN